MPFYSVSGRTLHDTALFCRRTVILTPLKRALCSTVLHLSRRVGPTERLTEKVIIQQHKFQNWPRSSKVKILIRSGHDLIMSLVFMACRENSAIYEHQYLQ